MISGFLPTILVVLLGMGGTLGWMLWRWFADHREHAMRYGAHSNVAPPSTVCPSCRRRSYGKRAVEESYCPHCDAHYGAPPAKAA